MDYYCKRLIDKSSENGKLCHYIITATNKYDGVVECNHSCGLQSCSNNKNITEEYSHSKIDKSYNIPLWCSSCHRVITNCKFTKL